MTLTSHCIKPNLWLTVLLGISFAAGFGTCLMAFHAARPIGNHKATTSIQKGGLFDDTRKWLDSLSKIEDDIEFATAFDQNMQKRYQRRAFTMRKGAYHSICDYASLRLISGEVAICVSGKSGAVEYDLGGGNFCKVISADGVVMDCRTGNLSDGCVVIVRVGRDIASIDFDSRLLDWIPVGDE